jgi:hypothetical protein
VSSANLMIELEACVATQSWLNREYRRGLSTDPCGAPVLRIRRSEGVVSYHLGAARQEVQDPVAQNRVQTRGRPINRNGRLIRSDFKFS